jgi:hypothetical protein
MFNRHRSSLHGFVSMDITFRTIPVFFLLYLSIQFGCCYGAIFLCTDNTVFFHNGTSVSAEIGEPVSVSFCVDTDSQVYNYIRIKPPYRTEIYYPTREKSTIGVTIVKVSKRATINITINPVFQSDFSERFYVTVFRGTNASSGSVKLWFQLEKTEREIWLCPSHRAHPTTVNARLGEPASFSFCALTNGTFSSNVTIARIGLNKVWYRNQYEDNKIYVNISQVMNQILVNVTIKQVQNKDLSGTFNVTVHIKEGKKMIVPFQLMELTGETVQEKVESTSTSVSTQQSPSSKVGGATPPSGQQCLPRIGSGCPESWSPVDDQRCLNVFTRIPDMYAATQCSKAGWSVIGPGDIVELKACLEYLLENSTVKVVKTGGRNYDVRNGSEVSRNSDYMVACLVGRSQVTTTASSDVESTSQSTASNQTGVITQTFSTTATTQLTSTATVAEATTGRPTTRTTTSSTTTTSEKAARPRCLPQVGSGCPEGFYSVDNNFCLNVFPPPLPSDYSSPRCDYFDVSFPIFNKAIKTCLEDLLDNTAVKVIHLNGRYYNLPTGNVVSKTPNYRVACLVDKRRFVQPNITDFYMESFNYSRHRFRIQKTSLIGGTYKAVHNVTKGWSKVVCLAAGYPAPEVTLSRDNLMLLNFTGGILTIAKPSCLDSGLYVCHARNVVNSTQAQRRIHFISPIKIQPVQIKNNRTGNTDIRPGNHVTVRCSVTGCPSPDVLTLANDANLTRSVFEESSVIHEISSVQCSDMGAYLCRVETDGQETRADLRVDGCAVQLCRGENKSTTIPRNLNQTTSFSVCLISHEKPTWEKKSGIKNIYVTFTRRSVSSIYFTAEISISKIEEDDNDTSTVVMKNSNGRFEYHIQLQSDRQTPATSNNHGPTPAPQQSSPLPVVLPLVLIVLIVAAIVGVVCYRHKVKRREIKSSSMRKVLNTSDSANDESGQAMYANFREITSGSSSQETTVQEDVIVESCGDNDLASYITDEDSGRFISDEGLVYLTVVEVASKIKKKPQDAKRKPQEVTNNVDDHVEYMTLDFEKTGKFLIPEDSGAGLTEEQTRQEDARDAQPRTNDSKE